MQKKKKKFITSGKSFFLLFLLVLGIAFFFWNGPSFSLSKVQPSQGFFFQTTKGASQKELEHLKEITAQPFIFLDEGGEFYVFISQDQKYVIKFFKMRRLTPKYWLNYIPIPWLDKKRLSKVDDRERMRIEIFNGLKNSFERFRYRSGLVFLHLFRTDYLKIKLRVIDAQGKTHKIPLDSVPFVMQKKAVMLREYIHTLVQEGKEDVAIHSLCQILEKVKETCLYGFAGSNERIEQGYGFVDGRIIHVGAVLVPDSSLKSLRGILREVFRVSKEIESWLAHNFPSLLSGFQEEVQEFLSCLE